VLAYNACKPRWHVHARAVRNNTAVVSLDHEGHKIPLEWTQEQDMDYLMESWNNFQHDLRTLLDKLYLEEYVMAVKGKDNYRYLLYPEYKIHRANSNNELGRFVPGLRRMAVAEGLAIEATGREADDLLRIWANQCRRVGKDYVVCTIDKDLRMIPGKYYNMNKEKMEEISEFLAMQLYYQQIISGDPTDNIPGIPGLGPKKAQKFISEALTEEEMQEIVVGLYIDFYQDEWMSYLLGNAKMIHLQNHPDDYFSLREWPIIKELT
jgi:5'-3' exonuclease